jgi:hypothetical protein
MWFSKLSADDGGGDPDGTGPKRAARGMTLVELLVSQTIVLFVVGGVFSLVVAFGKSFHAADGASQAQIRVREIGHVLLRDLTALGGADGRAGELLQVEDSTTAPDAFAVFKVNPGLCAGGVAVTEHDGAVLRFAAATEPCPFADTSTTCPTSMLQGRTVVVVGERASMLAKLSTVNPATCTATVAPGDPDNDDALARLRRALPTAELSSMNDALELLLPGSVRVGSRFAYRVAADRLERSVDGAAWTPVVDGVHDLQIARAYDVDGSGTVEDDEWLGKDADHVDEEDLAGASARSYFGAEVVVSTFGKAADGILEAPPSGLQNRAPTTATPEQQRRRYRTVRLFMAARNRGAGSGA